MLCILFFFFCIYFIFNCCHLANKLYHMGRGVFLWGQLCTYSKELDRSTPNIEYSVLMSISFGVERQNWRVKTYVEGCVFRGTDASRTKCHGKMSPYKMPLWLFAAQRCLSLFAKLGYCIQTAKNSVKLHSRLDSVVF